MNASQKINRICSDLTDLARILGDLGNEKLSQAILELEQIADELKEEIPKCVSTGIKEPKDAYLPPVNLSELQRNLNRMIISLPDVGPEDSENLCIVSDALQKVWRNSIEENLSKYTVIVNRGECSKLLKEVERWTALVWIDGEKPTDWNPFDFDKVKEKDNAGITAEGGGLTWYSERELNMYGDSISTISYKEFLNLIKTF